MDSLKLAVIGNPISHSKSPVMHQAALDHLNIKGSYDKVCLEEAELEHFFSNVRSGDYHGLNVTLPFKEKVLPFVDDVTELAKDIGAINTIYFQDQKLIGDNTDGPGYWNSLIEDTGFEAQDKVVIILGCGGASKAICFSLLSKGFKKIILCNRKLDRAQNLCQTLSTKTSSQMDFIGWDVLSTMVPDLIINTTSLGLENNPWTDTSFIKKYPKTCLVSDIVYHPMQTEFLRAASKYSLKTHYGLGMLIHQGALAFEKFTGQKAPLKVMRKAVEESLLATQ